MNSEEVNRAVSPVVAVILMVAITVILSAVIGTFVLDLGQQTVNSEQSNLGVTTSTNSTAITVTVVTGTADTLRLLVNGSTVANASNVTPGDTLSATVSSGATVTVVRSDSGESSVVVSETIQSTSGGQTGASTVASSSLHAHWKFDDDSDTTVAVDSASSFDAIIKNATYTTSARDGNALSFDGTNDYLNNTTKIHTSNHSEITVTAWINANTYGNSKIHTVFRTGSVFLRANQPWQSTDLSFLLIDTAGNAHRAKLGQGVLNSNQWYFAVGRYNGTSFRLDVYNISGGVVASDTSAGGFTIRSDSEITQLGAVSSADRMTEEWNGTIDDVRVYDKYLSDSEVQDIYNATK